MIMQQAAEIKPRSQAQPNWAPLFNFLKSGDFKNAETCFSETPLESSVLTQILFKCIDGFGDDAKLSEIARFLIAKGAKASARRGGDFKSPLHLALLRNKIKTAEFLVSQVVEESKRKILSLLLLKLMEEIKYDVTLAVVVAFLLERGADVNVARATDLMTPMHLAMVREQTKTLEILFKHKPNLNAENCEGRVPQDALLAASLNSIVGESKGRVGVMWGSGHGTPQKSPLQKMIDALPDAAIVTPFLVELDDCEVTEIVKQLKYSDYKAYKLCALGIIDCSKFAPVKAAVKIIAEELAKHWDEELKTESTGNLCNLSNVELMIRHGMNIDWQEPQTGKTLLHYAVEQGHDKLIALLKSSGANIDIPAGPFHITARQLEADRNSAEANPVISRAGPVKYGQGTEK